MAVHHQSQPAAAPNLRQTALLVAGDVATFVLFAVIGRASHSEAAGLSAIVEVAKTAAPFALGWFVVAPWLGAFSPAVATEPRQIVGRVALAWLLALPLGLVGRALLIGRGSPLSFAVVTFLVALAMLLIWRVAYAWVQGRRVGN